MSAKNKNSLKKSTEKTKSKEKTVEKKVAHKKGLNSKKPVSNCGNDDVLVRRHYKIQEAAYYRAEKRNFVGGDPVEDWIASEAEIDAQQNTSITATD